MIVKMKKKEILKEISDLKEENKSLKNNNICLHLLQFVIAIMAGIFLFKGADFPFPLLLAIIMLNIAINANDRVKEKNDWAIETLNKIIGIETTNKPTGEENEVTTDTNN